MKRIMVLLVVTLVTITAITGQQQYWEPSKGPYGGSVNLVKTGDGVLYATTQYTWKGSFRSTDEGHTWQQLTFLQSFFPNDPYKRVYIGQAGTIFVRTNPTQNIYKTTDEGQTWVQINSAVSDFLELPSGILIGINSQGIIRSTNGGMSWVAVQSNQGFGSSYPGIFTNTPFGGLFFVYNSGGIPIIVRSIDEGLTWTTQSVGAVYFSYFITPSGTILATSGGDLFRSTGGDAFQKIDSTFAYGASYTALNSGRIISAQFLTRQYSDDDGITWHTEFPYYGESGGTFQPISPLGDGTIFKSFNNTLVRSSDGGETWQFSGTGMRLSDAQEIKFLSDSVYFAATPHGVWKTADQGENWALLSQNKLPYIALHTFDVTPTGTVAITHDYNLLWSGNGGDSFSVITPPDSLYSFHVYVNPGNESIFVETLKGLEISMDQGQTWQLVWDSIDEFVMGFHPSGRIILGTNSKGVFVSDNNGLLWTSVGLANNVKYVDVKISPDGIIYLTGIDPDYKAYLWRSKDLGATWVKLPTLLNGIWGGSYPMLDIASNGHLYAVLDRKNIFLSINEGATWQNIQNPIDSLFRSDYGELSAISISPNQHLFVGSAHFDLSKSTTPISQGSLLEGFVKIDADADCTTSDSQSPFRNRTIVAEGANFTYLTTTDPFGHYGFFLDTGAYKILAQTPNTIWWDMCDSAQTINIPAYFTTDTANFSAIALAECPLMTVNVSAPFMRRCFDNEVYVQYCNQGSETADSAWVDVLLDPFLSFIGSNQSHNDLGNNTIRFFVGNIASGECDQFQLTVNVTCDSTIIGQTHCITAHGFPDTLCTTLPNWSGANIKASVTCQDTIVHFELQNTGPAGSQILNYIIIEDDVVMLQGNQQYSPGQSLTLPLPANGHTLRIESEQEPGHPFSTRAIAFEEGCGGFESLGFINQFSVNGITPSWHTMCRENTGAYDPNDKQGYPLGSGAEHRIRPGQPIEYMVRFQNTGTDTAFTVVVRDTLSAWLDPASMVPGAASHPYTWKLEGQGVVTFTFSNILLPDSTANLAGSQGFVTFSVAQQRDVPLGTEILNRAAIFFDFNEPVITNETLHTVGVDLVLSAPELPKQKMRSAVQVSPNPAGEFAAFRLVKGDFKGHRVQVFSPLGKLVLEEEVSGGQNIVARNNLAAGAYGWRILDRSGKLVGSGVLVFR